MKTSFSITSRLAKSKLLLSFLFLFPLLLLSKNANALVLTLTHDGGGTDYHLSWTAVAPSTDTAVVTYYVFQEFGNTGVTGATSANAALGLYDVFTDQTSADVITYPGSRCFVVISSDSAGGPGFLDEKCHGFIHNLTKEGIARTDGDGTQRGVDQKWTFTYSLDRDAYFTARVYPPGTQFTTDANGFVTAASSAVVKTLVENTPRSGELANHTVTMEETWDSRTSTGVVVPNGIYYVLITASLDSGFFPGGVTPFESNISATRESLVRDSSIFTIPVDILRIMKLKSTGITLTNPTATITYDLTGDALVRVVIAKPGSSFTVDTSGDIQPTDRTTGAIDTTLIVSSFTFQRKAGTITESWDGTSSTGAVMASGVYAAGISAKDEYGNHAIDATGNDAAIFTTVTLERAPGSSSSSSDSTADTTAPTLTSISPANTSTLNSSVSTMTIVLTDTGGSTLDLSNVSVTITSPNSTVVTPASRSNDSTTNTITLVFSPALQTNGAYSVAIIARDIAGNTLTTSTAFAINIRLEAGEFEGSIKMFPNPAKNTAVTLQYGVSVNATTEIEIFTINGERVRDLTFNDTQGTATHVWDLRNMDGEKVGSGLYLVHFKAVGSGSTVEATKKLVVIQ